MITGTFGRFHRINTSGDDGLQEPSKAFYVRGKSYLHSCSVVARAEGQSRTSSKSDQS
jgi:hypothetical protein